MSCSLRPPAALTLAESEKEEDYTAIVAEHLLAFANRTPLDTLAWLALEFGATADVVGDIFGSYDGFLGILSDDAKRTRLEELTPDTMRGDRFQRGLSMLFFDTDSELRQAAQRYGVF